MDYLLAEKNLLLSKVQYLDESINAVKNIDRENDVALFAQQEGLTDDIPDGLALYSAPNPHGNDELCFPSVLLILTIDTFR